MMMPAFYKPPPSYLTSEIPLKPRSKWRQALLDAAHRDIDACTCHTDFVFAVVDHSKAWLAELNQWNKVPTNPDDLVVWNTFIIKNPQILLQRIRPTSTGFIPEFWFTFRSNIKPGRLSLTNLPDVLPWTSENAVPYEAGSKIKTVYRHTKASGNGHHTHANAILKGDIALKYVQHLTQYAAVQPYQGMYRDASVDLLERRAVFAQTLYATTPTARETWLGQRMESATQAVQNAPTLREVEKQVTAHMATWYAAAHKWEDGPPDAAAEAKMQAYQADLRWAYVGWFNDSAIGAKAAEGPGLRVTADYLDGVDFLLLAKVLRQVPLGFFMDAEASKLCPDEQETKKPFTCLRMNATASSAYCALGRILTMHKVTRIALDLPEDTDFRWHEKHYVAEASMAAIAPIFDSLDL